MKALSWAKQWLIPCKKNYYHPYALRPIGLVLISLFVIAQPVIYNSTTKKHFQVLGYSTDISVSVLFSLTNDERARGGLGPLSLNSMLTQAAQNRAQDMFAKNYWDHISPDGLTAWSFISTSGYDYAYAGENLAKDFSTSAGVMAGWMNSPEHRNNILSNNFVDLGIAVMNGNLLGAPTTLVVAMYAEPTHSPPLAAITTPPATNTPPPPQTSSAQPTKQNPPAATPPQPISGQPGTPAKAGSSTGPSSTPKQFSSSKAVGTLWPNFARAISLNPLNWGQRVTVLMLSVLVLVNLLKHTLVWRVQKRGKRNIWLRSHPLAQAGVLILAIIITVDSSYGVIL